MRTVTALILIAMLAVVFELVDDGAARFSILLACAIAYLAGASTQRTASVIYEQRHVYLKDRRKEENIARDHETMYALIQQGRREEDHKSQEDSLIILDPSDTSRGEMKRDTRATR